jgi:hypothetical protein
MVVGAEGVDVCGLALGRWSGAGLLAGGCAGVVWRGGILLLQAASRLVSSSIAARFKLKDILSSQMTAPVCRN